MPTSQPYYPTSGSDYGAFYNYTRDYLYSSKKRRRGGFPYRDKEDTGRKSPTTNADYGSFLDPNRAQFISVPWEPSPESYRSPIATPRSLPPSVASREPPSPKRTRFDYLDVAREAAREKNRVQDASYRPAPAPFFSDRPAAAPIFSDKPPPVPLFSDRPAPAPLFSDRPAAAPLFSDRPAPAPLFSDRPAAAPLFSDRPGPAPLSSERSTCRTVARIPNLEQVVSPRGFATKGRTIDFPEIEAIELNMRDKSKLLLSVREFYRRYL